MKWIDLNPHQRKYLKAKDRKDRVCEYLFAYDEKLKEQPGIYAFERNSEPTKDGSSKIYMYVGQAKKIVDRLAEHLVNFDQRIDVSLKVRGLYSDRNPYGWKIRVFYCDVNELDQKERDFIEKASNKGYTLYNITSGGQDEGKTDINKRAEVKTYRDGLKQGYNNCIKEVKEYFDKYLDVVIKEDSKKKDGSTKEIYIKKEKEFKELIKWKKQSIFVSIY